MKKTVILIVIVAIVLVVVFAGTFMSQVETPDYTVEKKADNIEIRVYPPLLVAYVVMPGERREAINEGFKVLADFIFGNNEANVEVSMTAPVRQAASEKIAMTAPVRQSGDQDQWRVEFVMPKQYTLESVPKPNNERVKLEKVVGGRFVAIRFAGNPTPANLDKQLTKLQQYITEHKLTVISGPEYAFYNPPWTFPLMKRNEILFRIAQQTAP